MSAGMRATIRVVLVFVAALVILGTVGGLGTLAYAVGGSRIVNDKQELPDGMRSLAVDTGNVPVSVRLITDADATEPRIDLRMLTSTDSRLTIANDGTSSRVTLDGGSEFLWGLIGTGEIKVILPPDVARDLSVTVNYQTGALSTDGDLDQLIARSDVGSVTLGGSARLIDVGLRHGDIRTSARIAVTESIRATTESGRISLEFSSPPRTSEATAGGAVTVGLPGPGPYRVRAQAQGPGGETTVTVPQTADLSAPGVTAQSKSGNVLIAELR